MLKELFKYVKRGFILMMFYSSMTACRNSRTIDAMKNTIDSFKVDYSGDYNVCDTCESTLITYRIWGGAFDYPGNQILAGKVYISSGILKKYDSLYKYSKRKYYFQDQPGSNGYSNKFPSSHFIFFDSTDSEKLWCNQKVATPSGGYNCIGDCNDYLIKGKFVDTREYYDGVLPMLVFKMRTYRYIGADSVVERNVEKYIKMYNLKEQIN